MNSIKIMVFFWQLGIVDSLTFLQFCINCGAQYTGLTLGEAAGYIGMAMSGRSTLTDPASGVTIASFIGHMKSVIEKSHNSTEGLVFVNPEMFSKLTNDEFIVLNVIIVGGVLLIIISSYVLPRIAKVYWNYSKKLSQYIITFSEKRIRKMKKSKKIRKLGSKIILPFKYIGLSSIRVRNKIIELE